jgi:hypothetical protein
MRGLPLQIAQQEAYILVAALHSAASGASAFQRGALGKAKDQSVDTVKLGQHARAGFSGQQFRPFSKQLPEWPGYLTPPPALARILGHVNEPQTFSTP